MGCRATFSFASRLDHEVGIERGKSCPNSCPSKAFVAKMANQKQRTSSGKIIRILLGFLVIAGALLLCLSDGILRDWVVAQSLLEELDVMSGRFFSTLMNRDQMLVAISGCEDHLSLERLLLSWPSDSGTDIACFLSEDALAEDANATAIADKFDVRVVSVHSPGWAAAWGAALSIFSLEGALSFGVLQKNLGALHANFAYPAYPCVTSCYLLSISWKS